MPRGLFSEADLQMIEREVRAAESLTSGEIVPLIVQASQDYGWVHWASAMAGTLLASISLYLFHLSAHWDMAFGAVVSWQATGAAIATALSFVPAIKRLIIPASVKEDAVHRQSLANFMAMGLHETRDRTGVLIYLSLLEHRVEILADRGIHEKAGQGYWEAQVGLLVEALRSGRPTAGICEAIRQIGGKLKQDFPRRADDQNEHPNELRFGHQGPGSGEQS